ncbi:MAG: right-handed parallel beta-helix repeat-containing protein [Victivallaceae bacterium]|nr:right-handed parallel beta-helix repeat-containing protein [Victivallaceae bacterium]
MNKKYHFLFLLSLFCLFTENIAWSTLPDNKINGKYYLSQSPWSGAITTAINDVNALDTQVTLVIDCDANLTYSRTVDKEVVMEFISGSKITIPDTRILTINGSIIAGAYQIFIDNTSNGYGVQGDAQIKNVLPEWWGAARNIVTDSSAAITMAVKFAQGGSSSRKSILFADGSYYINSPIPLAGSASIEIKGTAYYNSRIVANAVIESVFDMSDNSGYFQYAFTNIVINGNSKADYGIYGETVSYLKSNKIVVYGALKAGISIGTGFCTNFINCEILNNGNASNFANGLEFRGGSYHNAVNIIACKLVNNTGFGVLAASTCLFNVLGCTIEGNDACGIGICAGKSVNITDNYFELNGRTGFTTSADQDQVTVQSHIFFNGAVGYTSLGAGYSVNGVKVSGNYFTNDGYSTPDCFIYAAGLYNAQIENNHQSAVDTGQELYTKRNWPTYSYRNVSLNGQKFYYAPDVTINDSVQIEGLNYISSKYPATVKVIATGQDGSANMSFEINVLIKADLTIGGYAYSNQINTSMSTAPTITNGSLTLNNLPAGDWTFVYTASSVKIE